MPLIEFVWKAAEDMNAMVKDVDIEIVWETLERTASELETGAGDWETNVQTVQAGMLMLLDFPPEEIIRMAEGSRYPAKALIAWILYEAGRIELADKAKLKGLRDCWMRGQQSAAT